MDSVLYEQHLRLEDTHWWFLGRRQLVLQELARRAGKSCGPVLDVGCGTGGMLPQFKDWGTAIGLDSAPEAAASCRRRGVPFVQGWGTELPFHDASFGIITALDVVEHIPDDVGFLRELYRVLRPGGLLLVTVPAYQFLWSRHDEFNHHQRRYRRRTLRAVIERAGFDITKLSYYNTLLFPLAVARKAMMRFESGAAPTSHLDEVPEPLNSVLRRILVGEGPIIKRYNLPFGASLICSARRPLAPAGVARPASRASVSAR
jgi:SAM-dependent methyltransferase